MSKIAKGDLVKVISGSDKGKIGRVLGRHKGGVLVEGVSLQSHYFKKSQHHPQGAIIKREAPVSPNKLCLVDSNGERIKLARRQKEDKVVYVNLVTGADYRVVSGEGVKR